MSEEITLYDLPTKGKAICCPLGPQLQNLPYHTEWTEFPDIAPKFKSLGIPPNDAAVSRSSWTIPAIKLADGSYVMDSLAIAYALEKLHPEPSLLLDNDYVERTQAAYVKTAGNLSPIAGSRIVELLNPPSAEYLITAREKRHGKTIAEMEKGSSAEQAWENAREGMEELKLLLHEKSDGPYVQGKEPSFADFILTGLWQFMQKLDRDGDLFERGLKYDASFGAHYEACKKWLERDD